MTVPAVRMAVQFAGHGRLEGHPPGDVDGARFEARFVIYGLTATDGPLFGRDTSLFHDEAVREHGRGVRSAHFVAMRSGVVLEGFQTGYDDFVGHTIGHSSVKTRLRVYYDAQPDGTRRYDDRETFKAGQLVATYQAEEFFQINPRAGVFDTRVNYTLLSSETFRHAGVTADFADFAPAMWELAQGHNPEPLPNPEPIPEEEPFAEGGPGEFADWFTVGGKMFA